MLVFAIVVCTGCSRTTVEPETLNIPITEPILAIDPFNYTQLDLVNNSVYDSLIWYDHETFQTYPQLAKSWRRIDETTLEFELRDDVKFHDGTPFDADDVVATISYLIDPDTIFPTKQLYRWIRRIEKHGPYLVRIVGNEPRAGDLQNLSFPLRIFSAEILDTLEDKADYGRKTPIGTGPYKVVQMDRNKGIVLERNKDYVLGAPFKRPTIDRIKLVYVPDTFAQIAMLLTGDLQIAKDLAQDQVDMLLERAPQLRSTVSPGVIFAHLRIDSINRAGNPALMDRRVRQAIVTAINRPSLAENIVPGGHLQDAMCLRVQLACDYSTKLPDYDPAAARALLREAGYSDGFDLEITAVAQTSAIATAVAGDLAAIGIRASVQIVPEITFDDKFQRGEIQAGIHTTGFGNGSGAHVFWRTHFSRPQNDYWDDELLKEVYREGTVELDDAKRAEIYARGFDHINENFYMAPLVGIPTVFVHSSDVVINPNPFSLDGAYLYDISWAPGH